MKVIFLDRDGTMGGHGGGVSPKEFRLYKETAAAIKRMNESNYSVIMITNQSRIARGYFTEKEFIEETDKMIKELKEIDAYIMDYFYCPHDNDSKCSCHKPKTGLNDKACEKYPQIDLKE